MKTILSNVRASLILKVGRACPRPPLRHSSFIVHLSSFALLLAIGNQAIAQTWILDGKQTQVLKLEVSDPQALYTGGSRQMTAPLVYAQNCSSATSGLIRAYYAADGQYNHFFLINEDSEALVLSSSGNLGFKVGSTLITSASLFNEDANVGLQFEDHLLTGGWNVDTVPDAATAIMSRSYADGRYLLRTTGITSNRVIQAGNTLVISNGLITAIIP